MPPPVDASIDPVHPMWSLLAAVSGIDSEAERARLITTGLPSLVPCSLSAVALLDKTTNDHTLVLQQHGRQCDEHESAAMLSLLQPLLRAAYGQPVLSLDSNDWQPDTPMLPAPIVDSGTTRLNLYPLVTLGRRQGLLLAGFESDTSRAPWAESILSMLAQQFAIGIDNLRLHHTLKTQSINLQYRHDLLLQAAGDGIYGLDADGLTTFLNPAAEAMLGWSLDEVVGKPMHDMHHHTHADGSHYPREECPIYAAFKDGKVHHVDDEIFWHRDGSSFPVDYASTPIMEKGKPVGAVVMFRDITERKQAEAALKSALTEVQELKNRLQAENIYLQEEIKLSHNFDEIIGKSQAIREVLVKIEQVAETHATVLILGETGTGKELVARAIHAMSNRKDRPMVKVNCAALPRDLIESELFGHKKGSFTGALQDKDGRFKLADGGTLFLDEIGDLPLELQAKLLRVLQEGEFERIGDSQTLRVDVRIIAATNRDLKKEVENRVFREDLYYRLNVFPLTLPSLRERKADIMELVNFFAKRYGKELGKHIDQISQRSKQALEEYAWPGNIRELQNMVERAVILSRNPVLELEELAVEVDKTQVDKNTTVMSLEAVEREHICRILEKTNWVIAGDQGAARILDINPNTLRSRIKKLGITRK